MVRIRDYVEEDAEATAGETTEEEDDYSDDDDILPDPPDVSDPILVPEAVSAAPEPGPSTEDGQSQPRVTRLISPILRAGLDKQYLWYLLQKHGHSIEFSRSLQAHGPIIAEGLNKWASELQQLVSPPNGRDAPQCVCSTSPDAPRSTVEENRDTESSSQATGEVLDKDDGNKTENATTREQSNEVGDKQLTASLAAAKASLLSSPDLSDCELSDATDSVPPPDYDALQADEADLNNKDHSSTALMECAWSKVLEQPSGAEKVEPELTESADGKEPSDASEGEAAALPASAVERDCWDELIDDDHLFNLPPDVPKLPTPSGEERSPSPTSPTTERRRVKLENRHRTRQPSAVVSRFIFVPTEKIGRIIGKGGRKVTEIERRTGARIVVKHKKSSKPATQIILTGTDEQISKADEEISVIVRNFKALKPGEAMTASANSFEEMELKRLLVGIKNQVLDGEEQCRKSAD